jgi:hypothetical protein
MINHSQFRNTLVESERLLPRIVLTHGVFGARLDQRSARKP